MKRYFVLAAFILTAAVPHAQNSGAYMIPRIVYVGDPAALILPLPGQAQNNSDTVLDPDSFDFPRDADIDFHRVVFERRMSGNRLMIEFTAFVPGILELPVIEIGGMRFSGLTVTINSLIDTRRAAPELSRPASSLAMPGTALMLYGTMAGCVLLILALVWFFLKGRRYLQKLGEKIKRRRLFSMIKTTEKRLSRILSKGGDKREILDRLSDEFRVFLSFLTGDNCRAMTAREFQGLSADSRLDGGFLGSFFRRCDELRFCGTDIGGEDIFKLLADLRLFVTETEKKEREEKAA
jgi:hypothetical protein